MSFACARYLAPLAVVSALFSVANLPLAAEELQIVDPFGAVSQNGKRSWGPEQAVGKPDTPGAGDIPTAWASATPDEQKEWLACEYEEPVRVAAIVVHETYNPGAVYKITAYDEAGDEQLAWEGEDPTPRGEARGVSVFPVKMDFPVMKIKIYIDSPAVPGWNEIDAVGLRDADGETAWAAKVTASSTYASATVVDTPIVAVNPNRLIRLEQLVEEMQKLNKQQA